MGEGSATGVEEVVDVLRDDLHRELGGGAVGLGERVEERIPLAVGGDERHVFRLSAVLDGGLDPALSEDSTGDGGHPLDAIGRLRFVLAASK